MMSNIQQQIIESVQLEFGQILNKIEIIELLPSNKQIDYEELEYLRLPTNDYNIVWHPGVYVFIGNEQVYRVGVSVNNSRARVMQHLYEGTSQGEYKVWDIDAFEDRQILLLNVKDRNDYYWLLAIEAFLEQKFKPKIKSLRRG